LTSKLLKASIALIVVGVAMILFLQLAYVPKVEAYQQDILNYSRNWDWHNSTQFKPPMLADYGLDTNILLLITILGNVGMLLVFLGVAYLVILLIARLVNRVKGYDDAKSST
jgi:hypothetical protein